MKPEQEQAAVFMPAKDYDLAATLDSGQVFRWRRHGNSWVGVVGNRPLRLRADSSGIYAETDSGMVPGCDGIFKETDTAAENWDWLREFLQSDVELAKVLETFPNDEPMNRAVTACRGLRVLRQEPWECLASFILSSTKQIVQIRQIVARLCNCFGEEISNLENPEIFNDLSRAFPSAKRVAGLTEKQLRDCRMGFRAPSLLAAARQVAEGKLDLETLRHMSYQEARLELMKLRGVGEKIADCVLLFAYGFDSAFPVDVWVERALRTLYFPKRRINKQKLLKFAATHFGPHAGYAQQYLFHYMRTCHES
ncbi:MAG TPA: DNA glycosylase [Verrucomicrobiae bacterium]|nr:DNA glycosylase [Verrucomicrobiae bacterium]